jgi:hypothetical protein
VDAERIEPSFVPIVDRAPWPSEAAVIGMQHIYLGILFLAVTGIGFVLLVAFDRLLGG